MATPVDAKVYTMLEASRVFFTPRRGRDEVFCVHYERQIAATLCWARLKGGRIERSNWGVGKFSIAGAVLV